MKGKSKTGRKEARKKAVKSAAFKVSLIVFFKSKTSNRMLIGILTLLFFKRNSFEKFMNTSEAKRRKKT